MEQRLRFNEDALAYDRARPRYTNELFDAIDAYARLNGARALEIGPGTGQATRAMLERGAHVTAIELGESLAQVLSARLGDNPALNVITGDFMEYDAPDGAFDIIYSATAFHWLPQDAALKKVKRLLRPGGTLALFWNHPMAGAPGDAAYEGVRAAYARNLGSSERTGAFGADKLALRQMQLCEAGFTDVRARLFYGKRRLCADEYLLLMDTYSDHRALPDGVRTRLRRDIAQAINDAGGILIMHDTMDLYLGRTRAQKE